MLYHYLFPAFYLVNDYCLTSRKTMLQLYSGREQLQLNVYKKGKRNKRMEWLTWSMTSDCHWKSMELWVGTKNVVCCCSCIPSFFFSLEFFAMIYLKYWWKSCWTPKINQSSSQFSKEIFSVHGAWHFTNILHNMVNGQISLTNIKLKLSGKQQYFLSKSDKNLPINC